MNNKNVLQLISGGLLFISFFSSWIYEGVYTLNVTELQHFGSAPATYKLLYLLPFLGVANLYYGYMKNYNVKLAIGNCVLCFILISSTLSFTSKYSNLSGTNGFYLAILAMLVSIASIVVMKKEINSKQDVNSNG